MLNLYRGDSIFNTKSKPARYRSEGLTSSAFGGGGDPKNIERVSFLETVKQHIDHLKSYEKDYFKITDYISFSEQEEIAMRWSADLKPDELVACTIPFTETRYVFHMQIPENELKAIATGVWEFNYACNTDLKSSNIPGDDLLTFALRYSSCPLCDPNSKSHSLMLVKPSMFMSDLINVAKYRRANKLADKNDEWIILPNDLIEHGLRGTRIPRANFWEANHYVLRGEPQRNVNFKYDEY